MEVRIYLRIIFVFSSYPPIWHIFRCIFAIHYENH
nr:MAG TPA: hypothetical protein [Caudoviricetes sp.]